MIRLLLLILPLFLVGCSSAPIEIKNSQSWDALRGSVALDVHVEDQVKTVEYLLNDRVIAGPVAQPFKVYWDTRTVWNGPGFLKAVGKDAEGRLVATSALVPLHVTNSDISVRVISPAPYSSVSGKIAFSVEVFRTKKQPVPVDGVMFFVDGVKQTIAYSGGPTPTFPATVEIDTTQFANGTHMLFAGVHATGPGNPPAAMAQIPVEFNNPRVASRLLAGWSDVFLTPGESATLRPVLLWTNNEQTPAADAIFTSKDPDIARISPEGIITATHPGVTEIQITAGSMIASSRVIVNASRSFPHFAFDGQVLQTYDPVRSFFPRSLFYLEPKMLDEDPRLAAQAKSASINSLESGFFLARQDLRNPQSFPEFRHFWNAFWENVTSSARRHNMRLVVNGDNLARFPASLNENLTTPWASEAIRHVFTSLRDSKLVVAAEMIDESSGVWGDNPFPSDNRWMGKTPPIPDNAFHKLMGVVNSVSNRPPLSWPILWLSGEKAAANWMGDPRMSDYASNYWDTADWRVAYPWGLSLPQTREGLENVVRKRLPIMQRDRPAAQLISVAGPYYTKLGPGTEYKVGQDRLQTPAIRPESIPAQVFYGIAMGQAGIRAYAYDAHWKGDRSRGAVGEANRQTGAEPFQQGAPRWMAMAAAFRLTERLSPYLFLPQTHAPDLGPSIVSGARSGPTGSMLLAVNFSDQQSSIRADLTPYVSAEGRITRYRLHTSNLASQPLSSTPSDSLSLLPGEVVVWTIDKSPEPARVLADASKR